MTDGQRLRKLRLFVATARRAMQEHRDNCRRLDEDRVTAIEQGDNDLAAQRYAWAEYHRGAHATYATVLADIDALAEHDDAGI